MGRRGFIQKDDCKGEDRNYCNREKTLTIRSASVSRLSPKVFLSYWEKAKQELGVGKGWQSGSENVS